MATARAIIGHIETERKLLPLQEQIRQRAYEIYLRNGGQDGSDLEDWLQAEEEIRQVKENE